LVFTVSFLTFTDSALTVKGFGLLLCGDKLKSLRVVILQTTGYSRPKFSTE